MTTRLLCLGLGVGLAGPVLAKVPVAAKAVSAKTSAQALINIDVPQTRADLFGTDADRATVAAARLGQTRQAGALDALLDALSMGSSPRVAASALESVALHKSAASLDVLLHYAHHRNADVRSKAVLALGGLEDKRAIAAWHEAFSDGDKQVRAAAARIAAARKDASSIDALVTLLQKGDDAAPSALSVVGSADVARRVAELIGEAPDRLVAECLGQILVRPDLGKEEVYVEIVRAIGKIPGDEAVVALTTFISSTPEKPPRQSRREAQVLYEQRLGGENQ